MPTVDDTYLLARVRVDYGGIPTFVEAMRILSPIFARHGLELVASFQNVIGEVTEVIDLWRVPDANAVQRARAEASKDPSFGEGFALLRGVIREESLSLVIPTGLVAHTDL